MPAHVTISLGGIAISLMPDKVGGSYAETARASDFFTTENPRIRLQVHCGHFPVEETAQPYFETAQGWQLFHQVGKRIFRTRTVTRDPNLIGCFVADFHAGEIFTASIPGETERYVFPLSYPMGELYMMSLLGTGYGMLSHAAGVIYQGKGYLFTGNGGAGKTTTSRLWQAQPGAKVVNDDKVILRQVNGEFRLYGTPWHGEGGMALPDWAPLAKVFILKQASRSFARPLKPIEAATGMFSRAFLPLWDHQAMDFTLTFLEALTNSVDCRELHFLPDQSAVDCVLALGD